MTSVRTLSSVAVSLAACLLLSATAEAQEANIPDQLPAASGPPEEIQAVRHGNTLRDPLRRVDRAHLARALKEVEPGHARPDDARGRNVEFLPASRQVPQHAQEARERARTMERAPQPPAPTRERLREIIRQRPGGPEVLEKARQRGAPIGASERSVEDWLAFLNPFRVPEAHAKSAYSVTLTPSNPGSSSPYGYLRGMGVFCCGTSNVYMVNLVQSLGGANARAERPNMSMTIRVEEPGWYYVNFRAFAQASLARIYHGQSGTILRSFDYRSKSGWEDYPALLPLTKGYHTFYFILFSGTVYMTEANAMSL